MCDAPPVLRLTAKKRERVFLSHESYERMLDDLDNTTIMTLVEERLPAADARLGVCLDDVVRDLGFDPDEIFTKR